MRKQILQCCAAVLSVVFLTSCGAPEEAAIKPELNQMRSICELSVMECYYHNVAKYNQEDAQGILWWKKDKKFWIEYSGVVTLGIDASLLQMDVKDNVVTITIPQAEVQGCKVDENSLTKDSYIVDQTSAKITAEDETYALAEAQRQLEETVKNDRTLQQQALQRAKQLLEEYVKNIGDVLGVEYTIQWVELPYAQQSAASDTAAPTSHPSTSAE